MHRYRYVCHNISVFEFLFQMSLNIRGLGLGLGSMFPNAGFLLGGCRDSRHGFVHRHLHRQRLLNRRPGPHAARLPQHGVRRPPVQRIQNAFIHWSLTWHQLVQSLTHSYTGLELGIHQFNSQRIHRGCSLTQRFLFGRVLNSERLKIHANLSFALLIGHIVFLSGVTETEDPVRGRGRGPISNIGILSRVACVYCSYRFCCC